MILVDGEKYACQQCIRGHRSSTCKHIKRPLVLVRSRGRPLTDSFQRIAIFAEEIQDEDEKKKVLDKEKNSGNNLLAAKRVEKSASSCCGGQKSSTASPPKSCCAKKEASSIPTAKTICSCCVAGDESVNCKKHSSPVYVLKASKRQVYNVEKDSLRLLDPVVEIPNSKVGLDIIQKVSKNKKMHSCRDKRVKEELIQNVVYPTKHTPNSSCCSNKNVTELKKLNLSKERNSPEPSNTPFVYQFQVCMNKPSKPSSDKKQTEKAAVNNDINYASNSCYEQKGNITDFKQSFTKENGFDYTNNVGVPNVNLFAASSAPSVPPDFNNRTTDVPNSVLPDMSNGLLYDLYIADSCTVPGTCSCEPDKCACPDCTEHGKYRNSNLTVKQQFEEYPFPINDVSGQVENMLKKELHGLRPYGKVEMHPSSVPLFEQSFLKILNGHAKEADSQSTRVDGLGEDSSQSTDMEECYCEPDQCCCYNCIQHGIINGIRISDGICIAEGGGSTPQEIQLLASQFPLYANSPASSSQSTPTVMSASDSEDILRNTLASNLMEARMNTNNNNNNNNSGSQLATAALPDKEQWMRYHNTSIYANHMDAAQDFTQQANGYKAFSPANVSLDNSINNHPESINSQDELISTLLNH